MIIAQLELPAHSAREVSPTQEGSDNETKHFNEARALCAGSSNCAMIMLLETIHFNEARALCAGSCGAGNSAAYHYQNFNEARALCAGLIEV